MADKLTDIYMMIYKIIPSVDYNQWLKRLDIQLNELTDQNSKIVPKVRVPTNTKTFFINFGD